MTTLRIALIVFGILSSLTLGSSFADARPAARHHHALHWRHHHRAKIDRPHGRGIPITSGSSEVRINNVGEVIGPEPGK